MVGRGGSGHLRRKRRFEMPIAFQDDLRMMPVLMGPQMRSGLWGDPEQPASVWMLMKMANSQSAQNKSLCTRFRPVGNIQKYECAGALVCYTEIPPEIMPSKRFPFFFLDFFFFFGFSSIEIQANSWGGKRR